MRVVYHHRTRGREVEAVHIRGLCRGLEALGFETEVVGPPGVDLDPDAAPEPGRGRGSAWAWISRRVPQLFFECLEIGYNLAAVPRLWRRCRETRPEFLYERYALYNAAGVLVGKLAGIPTILELNDTVEMDRTRQGRRLVMPRLARWFEERIFREAAGLVVVSGYLRDHLVARGFAPERIRVAPNAVDPERFDPERVEGAAVRRRWGLEGAAVVGFAGSFAKWHGVDLLIRACADLAPLFPELRLLLVGGGPTRPEAEALAVRLGVAERVVFAGRVPHAEIPEYVAAMDVGVMPSSNPFGSPMKVFEYMAMARPAVAPRYRPLEEAIEDGESGLLFDPADPSGLRECLRALLADPERRRALGAAAREKVLARHQWVHNAGLVLELVRAAGAPAARRSGVQEA